MARLVSSRRRGYALAIALALVLVTMLGFYGGIRYTQRGREGAGAASGIAAAAAKHRGGGRRRRRRRRRHKAGGGGDATVPEASSSSEQSSSSAHDESSSSSSSVSEDEPVVHEGEADSAGGASSDSWYGRGLTSLYNGTRRAPVPPPPLAPNTCDAVGRLPKLPLFEWPSDADIPKATFERECVPEQMPSFQRLCGIAPLGAYERLPEPLFLARPDDACDARHPNHLAFCGEPCVYRARNHHMRPQGSALGRLMWAMPFCRHAEPFFPDSIDVWAARGGVYVCNGRLHSADGQCLLGDDQIQPYLGFFEAPRSEPRRGKRACTAPKAQIYRRVMVFVCPKDRYYHWLAECFSQVMLAHQFLVDNPDVMIYGVHTRDGYTRDWIERAGLQRSRFIAEIGGKAATIYAREAFILRTRPANFHVFTERQRLLKLRRHFCPAESYIPVNWHNKTGADVHVHAVRRGVGENEIQLTLLRPVFAKYGIDMERGNHTGFVKSRHHQHKDESMDRQLGYYLDADIVVGYHGSYFTSALCMRPGSIIFWFFSASWTDPYIWSMLASIGADVHFWPIAVPSRSVRQGLYRPTASDVDYIARVLALYAEQWPLVAPVREREVLSLLRRSRGEVWADPGAAEEARRRSAVEEARRHEQAGPRPGTRLIYK